MCVSPALKEETWPPFSKEPPPSKEETWPGAVIYLFPLRVVHPTTLGMSYPHPLLHNSVRAGHYSVVQLVLQTSESPASATLLCIEGKGGGVGNLDD